MRTTPRVSNFQLELRATLVERRERVVFVILRNLIPLIGILFLGWSAQNLIMLYFVDTLGAMWALITALAIHFNAMQSAPTFFARAYLFGVALFAGAFLTVFLAIPLGMPLLILMAMTDWDWRVALGDMDFVYGLISIGALSLIGMLRHYQRIAKLTPEQTESKREFGILMTRWLIVLLLLYGIGFLLGAWGVYVVVLGYVAATIGSEIFPERFIKLFGRERGG